MGPRHAVISRALLLAGLMAAVAYGAWTSATGHGALDDRIALLFATKLVLSLAVATWFVWTADRPSLRWPSRLAEWTGRRSTLALALLIAGSTAIVFATTPQIGFGTGDRGVGYGHDGLQYGWMAEQFSWFDRGAVGQFAYRFLPSMLVHYSGLGTFTGFRALNVVCHVLTTLLAYRIAMRFTASRSVGVLAAAFVVARKFGFKFTIYYPVITDGLGDLLLMAIVWATLERRPLMYVVAMVAAVATRENLLGLLPFNLLYELRMGASPRRFALTTALQAIPVVAFVLSRRYPVFVAIGDVGPAWLVTAAVGFVRSPAQQQELLLGFVNALGVLAIVPVLAWRRSATFLAEHYEWAWFFGVTLVLTAICGSDYDRYAVWMTPLAVALVASEQRDAAVPSHRWLCLLALQVVAMELFLPWLPDQAFYVSRCASHAMGSPFAYVAAFSAALVAMVVAMELHDPGQRVDP
jgi:hypothetical protein